MSEIKTCEQFVISELNEARDRIVVLTETIARRDEVIHDLTERYDYLESLIKYREGDNGCGGRFEFCIWEDYDKKNYDKLCKMNVGGK